MDELTELDELIDLKHLPERLPLGRSSIFALLKTGELESIHIGRRRYVTRRQLSAFIEHRKVAQKAADAARLAAPPDGNSPI